MMQWWANYLDAQLAKGEGSQGSASWKRAAVTDGRHETARQR